MIVDGQEVRSISVGPTYVPPIPKLPEALKILDDAVSNTLAYFDQLELSNMTVVLESFGQLKDNKTRLESLTENISKLYEKMDKETVPNVLKTNRVDRIAVGGKLFSLAERLNASIPEYKREAGYAWLINEAKIPELIVQRVNPKSLSSFVKSYFETNGRFPPEEVMTIHLQEYIQVRKA